LLSQANIYILATLSPYAADLWGITKCWRPAAHIFRGFLVLYVRDQKIPNLALGLQSILTV
jgi:hypothetical protein